MQSMTTRPQRPAPALLCLCGLLLFSAPALAAVTEPEQPGANGAPPTAGQLQGAAKAAEERENEASRSIQEMLGRAAQPSAAAARSQQAPPQPGARKTIYGDIIIHK